MGCNENRLNCTPDEVLAATAIKQCSKLVDPSVLQAEQLVFDKAYEDIINSFGVEVDYYVNSFSLLSADLLYGEQPASVFLGPTNLMMYIELSQDALQLSKFGFDPGDEFTGYVHIDTFSDVLSANTYYVPTNQGLLSSALSGSGFDSSVISELSSIEPKAGDLVQVTPLGCDRPGQRGAKVYEITEKMDEDVSALNPVLGHYVFRIRAKRFDFSFQTEAPREKVDSNIFENSFSGTLSTQLSGDEVSRDKGYTWDIDDESKETVFDMSTNNTDIYGDYY
tara:strand:- start:139 stop:978 length:840 start_codon:yes stop_codon:yes gene_type:complete